MSAFLAPVFAIGAQLFDNQGRVLTGGKLHTYYAGSTTAQATWTSSTQTVQNANPIILDSAGRITNEIWLAGGSTYKFVLTDSADSPLGMYDNVPGVNDANYNAFSEWVTFGSSPTYVSASQFTVSGNQVAIFQVGRRVQFYLGGGTYYGSVTVSSYLAGVTTVTINPDSTGLDATLFSIAYGFMSAVNPSLPVNVYAPIVSPTFTGNMDASGATTVKVPTATAGDSSTKAASTAFVQATAFSAALPNQTGNAGKFVTTNGTTASWSIPNIPIAAASGTVDAITATFSPVISLTDQTICAVVCSGANTLTNPTFAPNSLTAHTITMNGGQALAAGSIPGAGFVALFKYNLAGTNWELMNPKPPTSAGNHDVRVVTGNGYGSTNTVIRRFTTVETNVGTAITYADSATNGASFTINETGLYAIMYGDANIGGSGGVYFGASLNSAELTTSFQSIISTTKLVSTATAQVNTGNWSSGVYRLSAGDVVRAHFNALACNDSVGINRFEIRKVGV